MKKSKTEEEKHVKEVTLTPHTVSIALPGSIVDNAQSAELKTYLVGQIARAAVVFQVDEIVVFDEQGSGRKATPISHRSDGNTFLARLLQYLETPQYLRKQLFPMHPDLRLAGLLNPLDCPHHMRLDDHTSFREGVVLDRPIKQGARGGSYVDCGMRKNVQIDKLLKPGVRVTVRIQESTKPSSKHHRGVAVSPLTPGQELGLYWGYNVRLASNFGSVFTECPFQGGYDVTIGTSERGDSVDALAALPGFRHLLIVFGGVKGLEYSLECDSSLEEEEVSGLFHHYLNTCPSQGSRTIRTEEAVLISLASLRPLIKR
ncbi:putative methyltransferase C9orf114 isoform X2 [Halichondria panicea]